MKSSLATDRMTSVQLQKSAARNAYALKEAIIRGGVRPRRLEQLATDVCACLSQLGYLRRSEAVSAAEAASQLFPTSTAYPVDC
jgi:hypothetical protein